MTYWHYGQARRRTVFFESAGPHEKGTCAGTGKEIPPRTEQPCGDKDSGAASSEAQDETLCCPGVSAQSRPFTTSTLQRIKMPEGGEVSRYSENSKA